MGRGTNLRVAFSSFGAIESPSKMPAGIPFRSTVKSGFESRGVSFPAAEGGGTGGMRPTCVFEPENRYETVKMAKRTRNTVSVTCWRRAMARVAAEYPACVDVVASWQRPSADVLREARPKLGAAEMRHTL